MFLTFCGVLVVLGCVKYVAYIPDPEKDIEMWVQNLGRQRSFKYRYELKTQAVFTSAQGASVVGRGEHVEGSWYSSDSQVPFEYFGFGDIEYGREEGTWQTMSRGDESDILAQITRLLEFRTFEYLGMDDTYNYTFKANIPFLVPGRWKEMVGVMNVSKQTYLPVTIWAGLPDSSVYWRIELFAYNRLKNIDPPVGAWKTYQVNIGHEYTQILRKRLDMADIEHRLTIRGEDILLSLPPFYTIEDVRNVLRTRPIRIFGVTEDKLKASRLGYVRDNEAQSVYLTEVVCNEHDIKHADIRFDRASRPYLELKLREKRAFTRMIAFEVDSMIVGTAVLDTLKKIDTIIMHSAMSFYELQLLKAFIHQPLPDVELEMEGKGVE